MKNLLYITGIILSCSLFTLQSMDVEKNLPQLIDTLESINNQFIPETTINKLILSSIEMNRENIEALKNLLNTIKQHPVSQIESTLIKVAKGFKISQIIFDHIITDLTTLITDEQSINTFKTLLITILNQLQESGDFVGKPQIWSEIQLKQKTLKNIILNKETNLNAYKGLTNLKNLSTELPKDLKNINTLFDYQTKLFRQKKLTSQEENDMERIISELTWE